jgi:two-component system OmpR family response regulator
VLVVDDEPQIVAVLEEMLGELAYATRSAGSGADALRLVREFQPDAVLLDLALPDMRGEVVLENLRRDHPGLPVVMITGTPTSTSPAARWRRARSTTWKSPSA